MPRYIHGYIYIHYQATCIYVTRRHKYTFLTKILVLWPWEPNQWAVFVAQVLFGN